MFDASPLLLTTALSTAYAEFEGREDCLDFRTRQCWALEDTVGFLRVAARRFGIAGELFSFLWSNKRWWMLPMVGVLFLFGALLILAQSSAIAPFIYTLF